MMDTYVRKVTKLQKNAEKNRLCKTAVGYKGVLM